MVSSLSSRRRWLIFALALTAGVLNLVDRQIISVLKPTIAADLGWSDDDYGTLAAWFQGGAAVGFLIAGWIVDRLGAKWANAAGVAAWSIMAMTHGWAHSFAQFVLCRTGLGATEAMGTPSTVKTIAVLFPPESRSLGFGLSNAMNSLGAILAPLAIPFVALVWGWRGAFIAAGMVGIGWVLAWLLASRGVDFGDRVSVASGRAQPDGRPFLLERNTWTIAVGKVLSDATWWLMLFWMPDYFHRQFGLSGTDLGPPLALAYCGSMAGSLLSGYAANAMLARGISANRTRKTLMLASALCVVPVPLALHVDAYWPAVALLALALAGHQGFSTNLFGLIADVTPRAKVGRVTGFGAFCGNMGGAAISKVSGLVLAAGLGYGPLFGFAACSYLLALGWIQLTMRRILSVDEPQTAG